MRISADDKRAAEGRLEGAPEELKELFGKLLSRPKEDTWYEVSKALVSGMKTEEHDFSAFEENGKIAAGFVNSSYAKDSQIHGTLKLGDEEIDICTLDPFKDKTAPKDLVHMTPKSLSMFVDVPMSIIWGGLTYEKSVQLMQTVAGLYTEEYSMEKALERQMAPLGRDMITRFKREITSAEQEIEQSLAQIREKTRTVRERTKQIASLDDGVKAKDVARRLRNLVMGGGFTNLSIDSDGLHATATNVTYAWHGYKFEFGDYEIRLSLGDGQLHVKLASGFTPTDRQRQHEIGAANMHPHIRGDALCIGNYQRPITDAILTQEPDVALTLTRRWLSSFNEQDSYTKIWEWLPDEYYDIVTHDHNARPWENEDPEAGPGRRPTQATYAGCYQRSQKLSEDHRKLRCLDKPFGRVCEACPHFVERLDDLYNVCTRTASVETCMNCNDFNCPHLATREDACLDQQKAKLKDDEELQISLSCVACPFNRKDECKHGEAAFENCWSVQQTLDQKQCSDCEHTACPHNEGE